MNLNIIAFGNITNLLIQRKGNSNKWLSSKVLTGHHEHETNLNNFKFEQLIMPLIMPYNNMKWISNAVKSFYAYKFMQN